MEEREEERTPDEAIRDIREKEGEPDEDEREFLDSEGVRLDPEEDQPGRPVA